jgi:ubiquinone/menaquinone biosynthesis C-methylase UbiE
VRASPLSLRHRHAGASELIDRPGLDSQILADNLADIARVNRWLGGTTLSLQALEVLLSTAPPGPPVSLLDVGTGGADIPSAMTDWARRRGVRLSIVGVDLSAEILSLAAAGSGRSLALAAADGRSLPFADNRFDVATCSLVIHHLDPEAAVEMLREMERVARYGVIVNDLTRSWLGYLGALALAPIASHIPLTRHDGPLSVRRAYTAAELVALLRAARLTPAACFNWAGYRTAIAAVSQPGHPGS